MVQSDHCTGSPSASRYEWQEYLIDKLADLMIPLQDCFKLQGIDAISGYAAFAAEGPAKTNSTLVDFLLQSGAVLYVKTNVPQTMMVSRGSDGLCCRE